MNDSQPNKSKTRHNKKEDVVTVATEILTVSDAIDEDQMGIGVICEVTGTSTPPFNGAQFSGIYAKVFTPDDPPVTTPISEAVKENVATYGESVEEYEVDEEGVYHWTHSELSYAKCGSSNTVVAVTEWYDNEYEVDRRADALTRSIPCLGCGDQSFARSSTLVDLAPNGANVVRPYCIHDNWLVYKCLSVSNPFYGNLLYAGAFPLRARKIAVAAVDVHWRPFLGDQSITVPTGLPTGSPVQSSRLRFPRQQFGSVVLWQTTTTDSYGVAAQCPENSNIVTLDPLGDVYVQVNDIRIPPGQYTNNTGGFELWVQVIEL